jgi:hypothetical protein
MFERGHHASCWLVVVGVGVGRGHTTTSRRVRRWAPGTVGTLGGGPVGGRASDPGLSTRPVLSVTVRAWAGLGQFGGAAVFPVPQVVGVQTAGGPTAGHRAHGVAVFEGAA